jgi:hypothetical protein
MNIYGYILYLITPSQTIKHKNSEDISEDDIQDIVLDTNRKEISPNNYCTSQNEIPIHTSRTNNHVPFERYPVYECGYCYKTIHTPQYLYQDMVFCSIMCRSQHISLAQNTKYNTSV